MQEHSYFTLPDSVVLFCLPTGAVVEYWSDNAVHPLPTFSTFALTLESGEKVSQIHLWALVSHMSIVFP